MPVLTETVELALADNRFAAVEVAHSTPVRVVAIPRLPPHCYIDLHSLLFDRHTRQEVQGQ